MKHVFLTLTNTETHPLKVMLVSVKSIAGYKRMYSIYKIWTPSKSHTPVVNNLQTQYDKSSAIFTSVFLMPFHDSWIWHYYKNFKNKENLVSVCKL